MGKEGNFFHTYLQNNKRMEVCMYIFANIIISFLILILKSIQVNLVSHANHVVDFNFMHEWQCIGLLDVKPRLEPQVRHLQQSELGMKRIFLRHLPLRVNKKIAMKSLSENLWFGVDRVENPSS